MFLLISVTLIFASISRIEGQGCPEFKAVENFDLKSFAKGKWFEIQKYRGFGPEEKGECVAFEYEIEGDDLICLLKEVIDGKPVVKKLVTQMAPDAGNTAKLLLNYEGGSDTLSILDIDYDSYVIFYTCTIDEATNAPKGKELAWVNSRSPALTPEAKAKVDEFIKNHPYLDVEKMELNTCTTDEHIMDDTKE